MMNEGIAHQETTSSQDAPVSPNAWPAITPSQNIHPDSAPNTKKPSAAPKAAEIIIFSLVMLALGVLLSWDKCRHFLDIHAGSVSAIATIAIMVLTSFYVVYARSQWKVMETQLEEMQINRRDANASSERQLRAYVMIESANIFNVANPVPLFLGQTFAPSEAEITNQAAGPGVRIFIKNTGQTPAYGVRHWGNMCFREFPLKAPLPKRDPSAIPVPSILGRENIATKLLFILNPLNAKEISELRAGIGAVYVYGEITYRDTFGKSWYTHYRLMYHPFGGAIGVSTDLSFCDSGNEAN